MDDLHVEEYHGYRIRIVADEYAENPRKDCDNLGTIGHWHRRYNLGDLDFRKTSIQPHEHVAKIEKQGGVVLPLGLLDHSGLHLYIGNGPHWSDSQGWDSGHVGYIWVEAAKICEEYSVARITKKIRDLVTSVLQGEVATLNLSLRGGFVGRIIERIEDDEEVDSVYGCYPDYDGKAYGYTYNDLLKEGRSIIQHLICTKEIE